MTELRFLGGAALLDGGQAVTGPAARRHPMALLALLASTPARTLSRPKAMGLLWPDVDEGTGRNRLTSVLHPLRKVLGAGALASVGDDLRLAEEGVECDVWRFQEALADGRRQEAVALYAGPFLDGFYLDGSSLFDERVESERRRLRQAWREAVETLAREATSAGRSSDAIRWWETLASAERHDSGVAGQLVRALADAGRRGEALQVADRHARWIREEMGAEPDPAFLGLAESLRAAPAVDASSSGGAVASTSPLPGTAAVAVLPFETLGGGGDSALAEGVHSGIVTRLAAVEDLSVIARTSVRRYRRTDRPASEIGAELGVRWVMEGDVQASGQRFRINARLIDAPADRQVWGRDYDGELTAEGFFGMQSEIAGRIVESLHVTLVPRERARLEETPTGSLDAYRLCAEGRMRLDQRSREEMERALACFESALELDPDYGVAWVGVADALGLLQAYGYVDHEVLPRAESALREALSRDPELAEAHAGLGRLLGQKNRAEEAEREMRRALALRPGYAEAHNWHSVGLRVRGRPDEALASSRRAVALNPLSPEAVGNLAFCYLAAGRPHEALREARRTESLEPGYGTAAFNRGLALQALGRHEEALEAFGDLALPWVGSGVETARAVSLVEVGDEPGAREALATIRAAGHAFDEGVVLAALGDRESAFDAMARAELGGFDLAYSYWPTMVCRYLFAPVWETLRDDPRYAVLLDRVEGIWS